MEIAAGPRERAGRRAPVERRARARSATAAELCRCFDGLVTAERVSAHRDRRRTAAISYARQSVTRPRGRTAWSAATSGAGEHGPRPGARGSPSTATATGHARAAHARGRGLRVRARTVDVAAVERRGRRRRRPGRHPDAGAHATPAPGRAGRRPRHGATTHAGSRRSRPTRAARARALRLPGLRRRRACADDFGAAAPDRRATQGNDLLRRVRHARCSRSPTGRSNRVGTLPICGNRLWLKTRRAATSFFYAHLSAFAPEAVSGRKVKAGHAAWASSATRATPSRRPPHVHFEIHPGDGKAIDPHAVLRGLAGPGGDVPTGGLARPLRQRTREARPGALVEVPGLHRRRVGPTQRAPPGQVALPGAAPRWRGACRAVHGSVDVLAALAARVGAGVDGRGGRGVVELLLGAEQQVEDLVAQVLAHGERDAAADDAEQQQLAEAALALPLLGPLAQRVAGVAQRVGRGLEGPCGASCRRGALRRAPCRCSAGRRRRGGLVRAARGCPAAPRPG